MDTGGFEPPTSALRKQRSSADLRAHRGSGGKPRLKGFGNRRSPRWQGHGVLVRVRQYAGVANELGDVLSDELAGGFVGEPTRVVELLCGE
jgi:hypothetical protein